MNAKKSLASTHTRSHCEGADFRSRRGHRCLRFCILKIIGQRSQLDSMRSQFLWDMSDTANAPRQAARANENKENIIEELRTGPWHTGAPVQLAARLWWHPRQANLLLHGSLHLKAKVPIHKPGSPWEN